MGGIEFNGNVNNLNGKTQAKTNAPKPKISPNDPRIADLLSGTKSGIEPAPMPGDGRRHIPVNPITGEITPAAKMPGDGEAPRIQINPLTGEVVKSAAMPGDVDISEYLKGNGFCVVHSLCKEHRL